ncbi:MAG: RNA methyltransferase [Planctomycetaceae bacterium]|nr:RNA methyltransferase [Planctomycetaceae bacterium]
MTLDLNWIPIADPGDARLGPFLHLPLRKATGQLTEGQFIAEGRLVVERLLRCRYRTDALLVSASKVNWASQTVLAAANEREELRTVPIYVLPDQILSAVVGFEFHSGIMGCGHRALPEVLQRQMLGWFASVPTVVKRETLIVLPAMNSAENLGSIIRSGHGLGAAGLVLSNRSADHLSRRVIRVSMGHALAFPCWRTDDWVGDLQRLRTAGFRLIGVEHHPRMQLLNTAKRYERQALVFGNEFDGLDETTLSMMDDIVGLEMHHSVDSLNVAVTTAIALHHFV